MYQDLHDAAEWTILSLPSPLSIVDGQKDVGDALRGVLEPLFQHLQKAHNLE